MNKYYSPIKEIIDYLCLKYSNCKKILEICPGKVPFPLITDYVTLETLNIPNKICHKVNICEEKLPFKDKEFDFVYCRHVLEDVHNPEFVFNEIKRVSKAGYIETPSPWAELCKNIDLSILAKTYSYRGYVHHRYIIWNNNDKILKFLPKYPIIDLLRFDDFIISKQLHENPLYWNSYFLWDEKDNVTHKTYYHEFDFNLNKNYDKIIINAVDEATNNILWMQNILKESNLI